MFSKEVDGTIVSNDGFRVRLVPTGLMSRYAEYQDREAGTMRINYETGPPDENHAYYVTLFAPYEGLKWMSLGEAQQEVILQRVREALEWDGAAVAIDYKDKFQDIYGNVCPAGHDLDEFIAGLTNPPEWMLHPQGTRPSNDIAIRDAMEAYMALVQFDAVVEGAERQQLNGAAKAKRKKGVTDRLAWEIADFVPIAFGRIKLQSLGLEFHDYYVRVDSQQRLRVYRLLEQEPVFLAGLTIGRDLANSGAPELDVISNLSPERQMVDAALQRGSKPENLQMSPPILNGPDELCDPLDQQPKFSESPWWIETLKLKSKPWWKFW